MRAARGLAKVVRVSAFLIGFFGRSGRLLGWFSRLGRLRLCTVGAFFCCVYLEVKFTGPRTCILVPAYGIRRTSLWKRIVVLGLIRDVIAWRLFL